jgi:hypothetical protein
MKWGFFMREADWVTNGGDLAKLTEDATDPLHPYSIRFRFAPDEEGPWAIVCSIAAPYSSDGFNIPLPALQYSGYQLVCDPPLPENKGPLRINPSNRRSLQFASDGSPFIGLGTNMADPRHEFWAGSEWNGFHKRDHDQMKEAMALLGMAGGNFMRMYLMPHVFAPEWVNLGVYDSYADTDPCAGGTGNPFLGNCQYQSWAFDELLDQARESGIYLQLTIDPYPPIIDYETIIWGNHPYVRQYLEPNRDPLTQRYDVKRFFYTDGIAANTNSGVFAYWKRKYKYIMARWGYSANLAIIEPFNEVNQLLTYETRTVSGNCPENNMTWPADGLLRVRLNDWLTDISHHLRDVVDLSDPVASSLGESDKLLLVSFTNAQPATNSFYHLPFTNPNVDLIDVHQGFNSSTAQQGWADPWMVPAFDHAESFQSRYPTLNPPLAQRKPFNHGEFSHFTSMSYSGSPARDIEDYFHNYDVSFHNEIWASVFSGKFAAGTTWNWARVFWWPDALKIPEIDQADWMFNTNNPSGDFTNVRNETNVINVSGTAIPIENRSLYHHFKPLADMLANPDWQSFQFFDQDYQAAKAFNSSGMVECYYLKDANGSIATGWIHNRRAWVMNNFYFVHSTENYLGCNAPTGSQSVLLDGFLPNTEYHVTWFPTHMNSAVYPADAIATTNSSGELPLDFSTEPFGSVANNYLDTLHSDYAFIIAPQPVVRGMHAGSAELSAAWDFTVYPNPARDAFNLYFHDDSPKEIILWDLVGKRVAQASHVTSPNYQLPVDQLAPGAYWVKVNNGQFSKVKQLIIQ